EPVARSQDDMLELIWRYKELVDKNRGKPAFYQVSSDYLPLYLDAGFSLVKLGEEALVDLATFTIEGSERRRLRQTYAKAQRSNAVLEILPQDQIPPLLNELREVSDAWLTTRGSAEKGFSLGFWTDDYILQQPIAVVRHEGRIVAFANLWKTDDKNEFAVDLMRHRPDAPSSVMDLMFTGLMLEAKAQGYRWFNLGMAPLSGLPQHRLASRWSRVGRLFFRHADRFYNFEGLRAFKSKFKPEWRPKYLAYPGGLTLAQVLIDIVALIAESPKRMASSKQE
ncbi:MAG TPA: phosphatidylglycerol lysyltransferase domain-containing protein, partial [Hyphomicrobium sp.]|nr:phosphatidylglycerol lysyltransferase domain-containing protein [Hyphomicrobium sp.]